MARQDHRRMGIPVKRKMLPALFFGLLDACASLLNWADNRRGLRG